MEEILPRPCVAFYSPDAPTEEDIRVATKALEKSIRKSGKYKMSNSKLGQGVIETRQCPDKMGVIVIVHRPIYKK